MKAIIKIYFKKIAGKKVNNELIKAEPKLLNATKNTIEILCQQIKKYFAEHKIKTGVTFRLEEND